MIRRQSRWNYAILDCPRHPSQSHTMRILNFFFIIIINNCHDQVHHPKYFCNKSHCDGNCHQHGHCFHHRHQRHHPLSLPSPPSLHHPPPTITSTTIFTTNTKPSLPSRAITRHHHDRKWFVGEFTAFVFLATHLLHHTISVVTFDSM